jgi:hypothetical protein
MKSKRSTAKRVPIAAGQGRQAPKPPVPTDFNRLLIAICILLVLATVLVYGQTFRYGFIAYDDDQYVYENPVVKAGLTVSNVGWALRTFYYANWHPLTWISYLLDVQLFGMNAGAFHLVNVLFHAASTVLLFLALFRMTRQPWRCAVVAGVFALHPLHVESVAWVSERKDVLSTFLEMTALLLYARYVEHSTIKRYLPVFLVFALSVMAKPMLVTFPFVLLLLDYWPLRRISWPPLWPRERLALVEKAPLLLASLVASVLTLPCAAQLRRRRVAPACDSRRSRGKCLHRLPDLHPAGDLACRHGRALPGKAAGSGQRRARPDHSAGDNRDRGGVRPFAALSACRLVLVSGYAAAGDRDRAGRCAGACRPLHVRPARRPHHRHSLDSRRLARTSSRHERCNC